MAGGLYAMPMLVINMGGEMVYILQQRLQAQNIPPAKSKKVLVDVLKTMYNSKFIKELFKPQKIYTSHSTRQIFDRLAHSSIMRLNKSSMDKLFDLMTMGFKHQMLCCTGPDELLQVTLNHLETLKSICDSSEVSLLIDFAINMAEERYSALSAGDFYLLKQVLCRFFQDRRVKVSLFLQDSIQNMDGTIALDIRGPVPQGGEVPGCIRYYGPDGELLNTTVFDVLPASRSAPPSTGDPLRAESRPCSLGENLYSKERAAARAAAAAEAAASSKKAAAAAADAAAKATSVPPSVTGSSKAAAPAAAGAGASGGATESAAKESAPRSGATAELNLLANLLGAAADSAGGGGSGGGEFKPFKLNLFAEDPFVGGSGEGKAAAAQTITIDGKAGRSSMSQRAAALGFDDDAVDNGVAKTTEEEDDLLSLMDSGK